MTSDCINTVVVVVADDGCIADLDSGVVIMIAVVVDVVGTFPLSNIWIKLFSNAVVVVPCSTSFKSADDDDDDDAVLAVALVVVNSIPLLLLILLLLPLLPFCSNSRFCRSNI